MSISNELSCEIAVAILAVKNKSSRELGDLKEIVVRVHSILQGLTGEWSARSHHLSTIMKPKNNVDDSELSPVARMAEPRAMEIVRTFWQLMASNDFESVGTILSDDFVIDWPQSKERIRGRINYGTMNREYPSHGRWTFTINRIVANDTEAVSDVLVSDGVQKARAISFFTVKDDLITRMVEFWPDEFAPYENRRHLVEPNEG
jgi:hypothetical protein